jgi:multidrug resistance efflux pump
MDHQSGNRYPAPDPHSTVGAAAPSLSDRVRSLRLPDRVDVPRGGGGWLPWLLCLLLAASLVAFGVHYLRAKSRDADDAGRKLATAPPEAGENAIVLEAKGYVVAAHQIPVSPIDVAGRVKDIFFVEGQQVPEGQPLAKLDDTSFKKDEEEARSALAAAEEALTAADHYLTYQKKGYRKEEIEAAEFKLKGAIEREEQLRRDNERNASLSRNVVTDRERDQVRFDYAQQQQLVQQLRRELEVLKLGTRDELILQSEAQVARARAEVKAAEARLAKALWRLENCTIRAPVTGTILSKKAEKGSLVSPMSFNVAATLCEIADLADLEVDLGIQERDIRKVELRQRCQIRTDAYPDKVFEGHVDRIQPIANRSKAEIPVRVKIRIPKEDEGKYLRPEMGAVVSFYKGEAKGEGK